MLGSKKVEEQSAIDLPVFEQRECIGTDPTVLFDEFRNPATSREDRARAIIASEYWTLLSTKIMPYKLVSEIEQLAGGKKPVKKLITTSEKQRWVSAALFDRESRRREYEMKKVMGRLKSADVKNAVKRRQECMGQIDEYPEDALLSSEEVFRNVLAEDAKICKSWGPTWQKKQHKVMINGAKAAADHLFKAIKLTEKVGTKTDKTLQKARSDSLDKWPKEETKTLNARAQALKPGCSKAELKQDLYKTNPTFAVYATELRMAEL